MQNQDNDRRYQGLNTEELQLFRKKSQSVSVSLEESLVQPKVCDEQSQTEQQLVQRWGTEDECAICFETLKESDVLIVPDKCQHTSTQTVCLFGYGASHSARFAGRIYDH